jgi:hypothetical protein
LSIASVECVVGNCIWLHSLHYIMRVMRKMLIELKMILDIERLLIWPWISLLHLQRYNAFSLRYKLSLEKLDFYISRLFFWQIFNVFTHLLTRTVYWEIKLCGTSANNMMFQLSRIKYLAHIVKNKFSYFYCGERLEIWVNNEFWSCAKSITIKSALKRIHFSHN